MDKLILKIDEYEQSTFLTCLSACFLMARKYFEKDLKFDQNIELDEFNKALKSEKDFYQFGFLKNAEEKGYEATFITEVPNIYNYLKSLNKKFKTKVNIIFDYITINYIKNTLYKMKVPLIVFVDQHPFSNYVRTEHYVMVYGFDKDNLYMVEPWYGKKIQIPNEVFQKALDSLRNNLLCGAQIININK